MSVTENLSYVALLGASIFGLCYKTPNVLRFASCANNVGVYSGLVPLVHQLGDHFKKIPFDPEFCHLLCYSCKVGAEWLGGGVNPIVSYLHPLPVLACCAYCKYKSEEERNKKVMKFTLVLCVCSHLLLWYRTRYCWCLIGAGLMTFQYANQRKEWISIIETSNVCMALILVGSSIHASIKNRQ